VHFSSQIPQWTSPPLANDAEPPIHWLPGLGTYEFKYVPTIKDGSGLGSHLSIAVDESQGKQWEDGSRRVEKSSLDQSVPPILTHDVIFGRHRAYNDRIRQNQDLVVDSFADLECKIKKRWPGVSDEAERFSSSPSEPVYLLWHICIEWGGWGRVVKSDEEQKVQKNKKVAEGKVWGRIYVYPIYKGARMRVYVTQGYV